MIIDLVLNAQVKPPKGPALDGTSCKPSGIPTRLRQPVLPPFKQYSAYGLLLTNRQLYQETKRCLSQHSPPYFVDVLMLGNNTRELWPTWICCPARSDGSIESIIIDIRDCMGRPDLYLERLSNMVLMQASFRTLIKYIVSICCAGHTVKTLKLNIQTPSKLDPPSPMNSFQMGLFVGTPAMLSRMHPRMTLEDIWNNPGLALRLLAYRATIFSLFEPENLLQLEGPVWRTSTGQFGDIIVTVDGDEKAELMRSWEGIHSQHFQYAADTPRRSA